MDLDIPYIPDPAYLDLLSRNKNRIHSLHFSLPGAPRYDARTFHPGQDTTDLLLEGLARFPHQKKHLLLNGRFQNPTCYFKGPELKELITALEFWVAQAGVNGIILSDMYLLTTLSRESPTLARELEAIPSVNCMIDNADKALSFLGLMETTSFKMPQLLILDRSLNRNLKDLDHTSRALKTYHPTIKLALLANEGCLYQCPFKLAHDSQASLINTGLIQENMYAISRERGCIPYFLTHPQAILKSPFIRPEDQDFYAQYAHIIKIGGRTMGPHFLLQAVSAYLQKSFDGNLLTLLDAVDWMVDYFDLPNARLPKNFIQAVTSCSKVCSACDYCSNLFTANARSTAGKIGTLA